MKTIALESLIAEAILMFCENLAELGCPMKEQPDMWFRNLSEQEQFEVGSKILDIGDRNAKHDEEFYKMHQEAKKKINKKTKKESNIGMEDALVDACYESSYDDVKADIDDGYLKLCKELGKKKNTKKKS